MKGENSIKEKVLLVVLHFQDVPPLAITPLGRAPKKPPFAQEMVTTKSCRGTE